MATHVKLRFSLYSMSSELLHFISVTEYFLFWFVISVSLDLLKQQVYFYLEKCFSVLTGFYTLFAKNTVFPSSAIL